MFLQVGLSNLNSAQNIVDPQSEISDIVKEVMEGVFTGMFPDVPFMVKETIQQSWGVE